MNGRVDGGEDSVCVAQFHVPAVFLDLGIRVECVEELAILDVDLVGCYADNGA